ncbi:MAG: GNAT family N-acetyltransferase [Pseudomonadota bacterium]
MAELPLTRIRTSRQREAEIREAVRSAIEVPGPPIAARLARQSDAQALYDFLKDPDIHGPIYSLPRPLNVGSVGTFIAKKLEERERGEGLLFVRFNEDQEVIGYSDFEVWPEWGAGDLGGALRKDQQGKGVGLRGLTTSFNWMFEALKLEKIFATGALDNVRTARMMDAVGMIHQGEVTSQRPDGTKRQSNVWEITRTAWFDRHGDQAPTP